MKFIFKEPRNTRHVFISSSNRVHVFMPIMRGTDIGTNSFFNQVDELQEFFGMNSNATDQNTSIKAELKAYQEALKLDLSFLKADETQAKEKQERLTQINAWLEVIKSLEQSGELDSLYGSFPTCPKVLESMMQDRDNTNVYTMVLHPSYWSGRLAMAGIKPVFSLAHTGKVSNISALEQALFTAYTPLTFQVEDQGLKSQAMKMTLLELPRPHRPVQFENLRKIFHKHLRALTNSVIDLTKTPEGKQVDQRYFFKEKGFNEYASPKQYMNALLECCAPQLFPMTIESPFKYLETAEEWCVATQFLIGFINIYALTHNKLHQESNWGEILDNNPQLSQDLANALADGQKKHYPIETVLFSWLNAYSSQLNLETFFYSKDQEVIKESFATQFMQIKDSGHFDEFLLFVSDKVGDFVTHKGSICTSLATFASRPPFSLSNELLNSLERTRMDLVNLGTIIPDNPTAQESIFFDTKTMSLSQLQALHNRITNYEDQEIKMRMYAELKTERPDFRPQFDSKNFLEKIAHGQQDEADALLNSLLENDFTEAQRLLTVCNTSFKDYSGRTFNCTAYEYAYWAKDTHMCRMLERYMDDNTKKFLRERVSRIEELVGDKLHKAPRGLTYKDGKGITRCSDHYDMTPLIKAIETYINSTGLYTSGGTTYIPVDYYTNLEKLWLKVGLLQNEVPAHIANEYCHPDRTIEDTYKDPTLLDGNNPDNLKRHFTVLGTGSMTNKPVFWYADSNSSKEGLGISYGISRTSCKEATADERPWGEGLIRELAALLKLDWVRTKDLRQSQVNLEGPSVIDSNYYQRGI